MNTLLNSCDHNGVVPSLKLRENFPRFFIAKISDIRSSFLPSALDPVISPTCPAAFDTFEQVSLSALTDTVQHLRPSYCPLDSIPPHLFKDVFHIIGPCVMDLINSSLMTGCVPAALKHAVVQPLIKKHNLDPTVLSNFRPISKLPFLSKILEKVVNEQLQSFIDLNGISSLYCIDFFSET